MEQEEQKLKEFKEKFDALVKNPKGRIVVTSHINPDDDSIASTLATYYYLKNILQVNNEVKVVYSNSKVTRWEKIPFFEVIDFVKDISEIIVKEDLLILLDCQGYYRVSSYPETLEKLNTQTVIIDHHKTSPDKRYTLTLCYPEIFKSSNAEIFYKLFFSNLEPFPKDLAEILLIGIYGDTGSFRYISMDQAEVLITAKEIIEKSEVKVDAILGKLENYTVAQLQILGELLKNVQIVENEKWGKYSYTYLNREICNKYSKEQISSAKAIYGMYQKSLDNSGWGFLIYPVEGRETEWSVSFRSTPGKPNVRLVAQGIDTNGGGHDAAAGAKIDEDTLNTKLEPKKILEIVQNYFRNNSPTFISN